MRKLSEKITAIKDAVDRIRVKTDTQDADISDVATEVESMVAPSGNINITNTNQVDVTNYETAQVVDDNLISENIKKNVNILGIIGTHEGGGGESTDIYRVDTIEDMEAIPNPQNGDLCVVRSLQNQPISDTALLAGQSIILPQSTFTLTEAVTDNVYGYWRNMEVYTDFNLSLSPTRFRINYYTETDYISITWTSEDGLTYTLSSGTPTDILLEADLTYEDYYEFNPILGDIIKVKKLTFDGIYEYKDNEWDYAEINVKTTDEYVFLDEEIYTDNGFIIGTLGSNLSENLDDSNAEIYSILSNEYNKLDPIVLEDGDTFDTNIKVIPLKLDGTPLVDTSNVTTMNQMFRGCQQLKNIPKIDTSNVTDMSQIFHECTSLEEISRLDTSNVTNMDHAFSNCSSLTKIPELDTSNVTNMNQMFGECTSLTEISQLDTSNVTTMSAMFAKCSSLEEIPELDTNNVTNMSYMFNGCTSLTEIPELDTSNVTNMNYTFYDCSLLESIPLLDTSNVNYMTYALCNCSSLESIPLLDTSNVTNMTHMFDGCTSLTEIPELDTSSATNMSYMFNGCTSLTEIPELDTSSATNTAGMFKGCTSLTEIPELDTSNVTDTTFMFDGCTSLTEIPDLDISNATDIEYMFQNTGIKTLPNMVYNNVKYFDYMCCGCSDLEGPINLTLDLSKENTRLTYMFKDCTSLDSVTIKPVAAYGTSNYYTSIFEGCTSLKTFNLYGEADKRLRAKSLSSAFKNCTSLENVSGNCLPYPTLCNCDYMFAGCTSLKTFDTSDLPDTVVYFRHFFEGCSSLELCRGINLVNAKSYVDIFKGCTSLTTLVISYIGGNTSYDHNPDFKLDLSDCTLLTKQSLINVLNALQNTTYTKDLVLGETNLAKLTAQEIAIATNKGWEVS